MDELWQLYDEQGQALRDKGGKRSDIFQNGLLHGGSHVWIWRKNNGTLDILLQKRAAAKQTWPNLYDISAAGHIDLGETPLEAARREAKEEIDLDIAAHELRLFGMHRICLKAENGAIENEFQWLYHLEITGKAGFNLEASEVESLLWMPLDQFSTDCTGSRYVPHGKLYYDTVVSAINAAAQ